MNIIFKAMNKTGLLSTKEEIILLWWQLFNRKRYDIFEYQVNCGMLDVFAFSLAYNHKF